MKKIIFIFLISSNLAYASNWVSIWKREYLESVVSQRFSEERELLTLKF